MPGGVLHLFQPVALGVGKPGDVPVGILLRELIPHLVVGEGHRGVVRRAGEGIHRGSVVRQDGLDQPVEIVVAVPGGVVPRHLGRGGPPRFGLLLFLAEPFPPDFDFSSPSELSPPFGLDGAVLDQLNIFSPDLKIHVEAFNVTSYCY